MSVLLGRVACGLRRRRGPTRKRVAERAVHHGDLLLLIDDDLLRKTLEPLVLPVAELGDRHVDGTLVVRDHHAREVASVIVAWNPPAPARLCEWGAAPDRADAPWACAATLDVNRPAAKRVIHLVLVVICSSSCLVQSPLRGASSCRIGGAGKPRGASDPTGDRSASTSAWNRSPDAGTRSPARAADHRPETTQGSCTCTGEPGAAGVPLAITR